IPAPTLVAGQAGEGVTVRQRILVYVYANDPILQAGVVSQLRASPEVAMVDQAELDEAQVAVVVTDLVDEAVLRVLRAIQRRSAPRTVLIATALDESMVVAAAEAGVSGLLRRGEVTPERLLDVVGKVAAGDAAVPPDLLAPLLHQVGRLQRPGLSPRGLRFSPLTRPHIH